MQINFSYVWSVVLYVNDPSLECIKANLTVAVCVQQKNAYDIQNELRIKNYDVKMNIIQSRLTFLIVFDRFGHFKIF